MLVIFEIFMYKTIKKFLLYSTQRQLIIMMKPYNSPLLALQANSGAPISGPMLLLSATIDWPMPFTVPLVDDCVCSRGRGHDDTHSYTQ